MEENRESREEVSLELRELQAEELRELRAEEDHDEELLEDRRQVTLEDHPGRPNWSEMKSHREIYIRNVMYRSAEDCFSDILDLESECYEPEFLDWMVERGFYIERAPPVDRLVNDYIITIKSTKFTTIGTALEQEDIDVLREDIRAEYDYYTEEKNRRLMKRAGIATAVGLSLVSLITGLSLGLKRTGNDIARDAHTKVKSTKASKLVPTRPIIPWTDIQEASGKSLVFIGDHIYIIAATGGALLYYRRSRKT